MNFTRIGFIPTNGLERESHQFPAMDENLSTSLGLALALVVLVFMLSIVLLSVVVLCLCWSEVVSLLWLSAAASFDAVLWLWRGDDAADVDVDRYAHSGLCCSRWDCDLNVDRVKGRNNVEAVLEAAAMMMTCIQ